MLEQSCISGEGRSPHPLLKGVLSPLKLLKGGGGTPLKPPSVVQGPLLRPDLYLRTHPFIKNAGSMKDYHKTFILKFFGTQQNQVHLTKRDRYFFSRLKKSPVFQNLNHARNHGTKDGSSCQEPLHGHGSGPEALRNTVASFGPRTPI